VFSIPIQAVAASKHLLTVFVYESVQEPQVLAAVKTNPSEQTTLEITGVVPPSPLVNVPEQVFTFDPHVVQVLMSDK